MKKVRLQTLQRQLENLQMDDNESATTFTSRVLAVTNQMKLCGEECKEQMKVEKILRSLTLKFEHLVVTLEETQDLSKLTVDEVSNKLQAREERMNEQQDEQVTAQTLQAHTSAKSERSGEARRGGNPCGKGRGRHGGHYPKRRNDQSSEDKSDQKT